MINLAIIVSNLESAKSFEWIASGLGDRGFKQVYIFLNPLNSQLAEVLKRRGLAIYQIRYRGKKDIVKALWSCCRIILKEQIDVVHTHLFDASLIGLAAARIVGIKKRIYTRHHSTIHHQYFPRAVKYDRLINSLATDIIAISKNVRKVLLKERVNKRKLHLIPHGFAIEDFHEVSDERLELVRKTHIIPKGANPMVGVIARFTHWKGIQFIIPAFKEFIKQYPKAHMLLANAKGDYYDEIMMLLKELPGSCYTLIEFESDLAALYQLFDLYIHVPIDDHSEAFGQTYVEALAAKKPVIFSLSGIANEFIRDGYNAIVVDYQDSTGILNAMNRIISDGYNDKCKEQGFLDVQERFNLPLMINRLEKLYKG